MSNPYTVPTGEGYLGVWSANDYTVTLTTATIDAVDWTADDALVAIETPRSDAIAVVTRTHVPDRSVILADVPAGTHNYGMDIRLGPDALGALAPFEPGDDVRGYDRDPSGIYVVPAGADPFVEHPRPHTTEGER
ncbi:hypothetical protein ACFR9U_13850 [Halorientalis brevis]|uniref:Uncharacterized protein n=1 Tax=Halorientalis brevis TaxID=1126241 RepID=A0ABD6CE63_9EURY